MNDAANSVENRILGAIEDGILNAEENDNDLFDNIASMFDEVKLPNGFVWGFLSSISEDVYNGNLVVIGHASDSHGIHYITHKGSSWGITGPLKKEMKKFDDDSPEEWYRMTVRDQEPLFFDSLYSAVGFVLIQINMAEANSIGDGMPMAMHMDFLASLLANVSVSFASEHPEFGMEAVALCAKLCG